MALRERLVLLFYTLFNAIANQFIPFYSDENYYWLWSKKLDFSYFDHPPMVAYIIKITTLLGDSPFAIRLGATLLVSATAYTIYLLAKKMFDERVAIYSFYIFISSIMVLAASTLMTPDIPLMFFSSLFLYAAYRYIEEDNTKFAYLTGIAGGAMILSKYPGILIIFTTLLYALIYKREIFTQRYIYIAMALTVLVFSPVLYWNFENEFISFTFQLHHGIAEEKVFHAKHFFNFVGAQFVLFHPLYLLPLFYFILRDRKVLEKKKVFLLLPFLFILGFFSYFSAFKHANAQWAGSAYLTASILLGYYFAQHKMKKLLIAALSVSALVLLLIKTPVGVNSVPLVEKLFSRLGKINNFDKEIADLGININEYNYILIDDYHGSEIAYYFHKYDNILVLNSARTSNFNLWRYKDLNISMENPLKTIPHLGKALYIGKSKLNYMQIAGLFGNYKLIKKLEKEVAGKKLTYYIVSYEN
jgi:hypothetical protein